MKKRITGLISMVLAACITVPVLGGCGESGGGIIEIDETKTNLIINHYTGGVGRVWIDEIKKAFEEKYKDYEGEGGKIGVQLVIPTVKEEGDKMFDKIGAGDAEIYFTDKSRYSDMAQSNFLLDISDVVENENTDGKTIESKLTEQQKKYYKVDGKYYALPHYESFGGINYNVNIFDNKELYFAKGGAKSEFSAFTQTHNDDKAAGSFTGYSYTGLSGERSAGPDGLYRTYDDGLPATYEEFFVLCERMKRNKNVTPFVWSGEYGDAYMNYMLRNLRSDFEGLEQMALSYSFDGSQATHLVQSVNAHDSVAPGSVTLRAPTSVNSANGYEMFSSAGMYYALYFLKNILSGTYYSSNIEKGDSHTLAQMQFVMSENDVSYNDDGQPIAMLIEGNYWENEAREYGTFKRAAENTEDDVEFRYGLMPMPKVNEDYIGVKRTMCEKQLNIAFISSKISPEKIELAKELLKFCYTDEKLREFTAITGVTKGVKYDMNGIEGLTSYAQSVIAAKSASDVAYEISDSNIYRIGYGRFEDVFKIGGAYALPYLKGRPAESAADAFNALKDNWKTSWN